jgi:hypothetical protein
VGDVDALWRATVTSCHRGIILPTPIILVLAFLGRGKRTDCQQRSKIENEDDDEDDWGGTYTGLTTYGREKYGLEKLCPVYSAWVSEDPGNQSSSRRSAEPHVAIVLRPFSVQTFRAASLPCSIERGLLFA